MNKSMIPCSGKMVLLDKLLPKLKKEGHKVILHIYNLFIIIIVIVISVHCWLMISNRDLRL
jgi:hypothetical protein